VIVQPGSVYGPGDHALVSQMIEQASTGKMPRQAFPNSLNMVHVDDVADGSARPDKGRSASHTCSAGNHDPGAT
jgi:nucleoside-diphosphate-sugar epimerase